VLPLAEAERALPSQQPILVVVVALERGLPLLVPAPLTWPLISDKNECAQRRRAQTVSNYKFMEFLFIK